MAESVLIVAGTHTHADTLHVAAITMTGAAVEDREFPDRRAPPISTHAGAYPQFHTDISPGGYWLHTSVDLATTPLLLKKIFMWLRQPHHRGSMES